MMDVSQELVQSNMELSMDKDLEELASVVVEDSSWALADKSMTIKQLLGVILYDLWDTKPATKSSIMGTNHYVLAGQEIDEALVQEGIIWGEICDDTGDILDCDDQESKALVLRLIMEMFDLNEDLI